MCISRSFCEKHLPLLFTALAEASTVPQHHPLRQRSRGAGRPGLLIPKRGGTLHAQDVRPPPRLCAPKLILTMLEIGCSNDDQQAVSEEIRLMALTVVLVIADSKETYAARRRRLLMKN